MSIQLVFYYFSENQVSINWCVTICLDTSESLAIFRNTKMSSSCIKAHAICFVMWMGMFANSAHAVFFTENNHNDFPTIGKRVAIQDDADTAFFAEHDGEMDDVLTDNIEGRLHDILQNNNKMHQSVTPSAPHVRSRYTLAKPFYDVIDYNSEPHARPRQDSAGGRDADGSLTLSDADLGAIIEAIRIIQRLQETAALFEPRELPFHRQRRRSRGESQAVTSDRHIANCL